MLDLMKNLDLEVRACSWNWVLAGCVWLGEVELVLKVLGKIVEPVRPNYATFQHTSSSDFEVAIQSFLLLKIQQEVNGFAMILRRNYQIQKVG